jgi:tight adherence protein B
MNSDIVRLLVLLAVFAAVLLGVEVLLSSARAARGTATAINRRLALIAKGMSRDDVMIKLRRPTPVRGFQLPGPIGTLERQLEGTLAGAGLRISSARILLGLILASMILFLIIVWLLWASASLINGGRLMMVGTFAVAAGLGLPLLVIGRMAAGRRKKLVEQFPVALDVFVRALRAGHPVASALELVTTEMPDPIGSEFGLALDEVTYGAELRDALQNMADRCGVEDMQMFVVSLSIQAETGGNLAEILENLAKVIRERASMLMKVRALSSEGRMTALILTLLPVVSFVGLFLVSPRFYLDVADDPAFVPGFGGLILAFAIGVFWIRKLVDLKV